MYSGESICELRWKYFISSVEKRVLLVEITELRKNC